MTIIGVLAIQGDFLEHRQALERLGATVKEVRQLRDLDGIDGLIIPGGESTTIVQLLDIFSMRDALVHKVKSGMPVWGTCAGMIVLADRLTDRRPDPLHLMDIEVSRNAFGRQVDSFETDIEIDQIAGGPFRAVFIRAPVVKKVGPDVVVLGKLADGRPVAVRQGNMLASAFHPELTGDDRLHGFFIKLVEEARVQQTS